MSAAAVAALLGCAACGLPAARTTRVGPSSVPFGLLGTAPPGTAAGDAHGPVVGVYLVLAGRLATVPRRVFGANLPAEAARQLFAGPTPAEGARGLTSDVPARTRLVSLDLNGPVATVDLSPEFGTVGGSDQVLAVAQLVYTLTTSASIDAVAFAIDGKRIAVPDGSGSLSARPRTRQDYRKLAPAH